LWWAAGLVPQGPQDVVPLVEKSCAILPIHSSRPNPFSPDMKFSVSKEKLLEGLQTVQNVVSTRTTLPILSNVLLQAEDGKLRFTTTDLDVGISGTVEAAIEKPGATTLPARRLAGIVRELPAAEVSIEVDSKNVASIRCGQSFFKILGLPEEEFPPLPRFEGAKEFTLKQKELRDGLKKTSYAISTDETRYVLNGILFSFKDNKLTMVATDGRRLALVDLEVEFPRSQEVEIIVPTKCVSELARLVGDDGEVKMTVGENQVAFEVKDTLLVSKLIEGNYPNYRQVIPGETKERVSLERELFHNAVHRVSLLASEKSNSVKLVFTKNNIEIAANTPDVGEAHESLPVNYKGRDFSIAFNPEFLMAPLRALPEDEVYLDLIDEMSPGVIKVQTPFLYVLMPMRIS
jgi:DNA polymerase III subunit beta